MQSKEEYFGKRTYLLSCRESDEKIDRLLNKELQLAPGYISLAQRQEKRGKQLALLCPLICCLICS